MMGEIMLVLAGVCLAALIIIAGREKFVKKYPAMEFLLKEKTVRKKKAKKKSNLLLIDNYMKKAQDAGWNVRSYEVAGLAVLGMAAGVGFGLLLGNEILAAGGVSFGYLLPQYVLNVMTEKRRAAIALQLESAMTTVSSSFDVYGNVLDSLKASVPLMESPIKDEFMRVVQEMESGVTLEKSLMDMEKRVGKKELTMFNRVMVVAENAGGKAGEILQKCSRVISENRLLKSDLETEMAQAKQDTKIMFLLTVLSLVFFRLTNSELFVFYKTSQGKILMLVLLGVGVLLVVVAGKATKPKELD